MITIMIIVVIMITRCTTAKISLNTVMRVYLSVPPWAHFISVLALCTSAQSQGE